MKRSLISDEWAREYCAVEEIEFPNGIYPSNLTFCGAIEEFYHIISKEWNNETRKKYDRDYNNVILPHIVNHNCKKIYNYSHEDCEKILNEIKRDGFVSQGEQREYSKSQLNHFKYLISLVFKCASLSGYCKDFLWGTKFAIEDDREMLAIRSKTGIKKSLSSEQEKRLINCIMDSPKEDGRRVALLLMYSLGLRDGEACGLDYGDIYELDHYKGCYVAMIRQTTIPKTCIVQSSGKTWNSGRRIPIPSKVLEFLLERKAVTEEIIKTNGLAVDINRLPVAGNGYLDDTVDLELRLKADYVTEEARNVFKQVGISSEVLSTLEIDLEEECMKLEITERNATAYLLRRNFATHLKILGLNYSDIQYLLGHCIEDPDIERADYTDKKLYFLSNKMTRRPLVNDKYEVRKTIECFCEQCFHGKAILDINCEKEIVNAKIYTVEKNDYLRIKNFSEDEIRLKFYDGYKAYEPHKKIDVLQKYMSDYE